MLRIVIAEDSVLFREGLARLLTESGHDVIDAVGDAPGMGEGLAERHQRRIAMGRSMGGQPQFASGQAPPMERYAAITACNTAARAWAAASAVCKRLCSALLTLR